MKPYVLALTLAIFLQGCSDDSFFPYPYWYIGLVAPRYMEVWVETVDVVDLQGVATLRVHGGRGSYTANPEGWGSGVGSSKPLNNIGMPRRISLRWQSLAEKRTYRINVEIPHWVREEMAKRKRAFCRGSQEWEDEYRDIITLGMAPGGIVKVWVGGACLGFTEVGRYQAEIDPRGPYEGRSKGRYVKLEPENKAYIDQHGIPYGTW